MKLLLIRHGEPDYEHDTLTEKGWKEAEDLSERLTKIPVRDFYVSPFGRAKDTAAPTLKKLNRTAKECKWLREFSPKINRPNKGGQSICWDWLPQDWTREEIFYRYDEWFEEDIMKEKDVQKEYEWVTKEFDRLLSSYGYVRDGHFYRTKEGNHDTIVLFCHFGVSCVLLSHLFGISPMILWHGFCAAPSSVTTVATEERRKGIASFRMSSYGDISHLYVHGEPPAFSARFSECYEDKEGRLD